MFNCLKQLSCFISQITKYLIMFIFSSMVVVVILQVFFRYVVQASLSWSEELSRYFFVWIIFLAASICFKKDDHIAIEFFLFRLSPNVQRYIRGIIKCAELGFVVILIYYGFKVVNVVKYQISPAAGISMSVVYLSLPISGTLMLIHLIAFLKLKDKFQEKD